MYRLFTTYPFFFFFNDTATTEIYTLSLHDALPTLHSLRHTAGYRMAEDPALPLTDVQLVLGHAQLTTTQIYLTPRKEDVIRRILAHHAEQTRQAAARARPDRKSTRLNSS